MLVGFHTVSLLIMETPYQLLTWLLEDVTFFYRKLLNFVLFCNSTVRPRYCLAKQ